jgi:cold-inducible RNA-binding protein
MLQIRSECRLRQRGLSVCQVSRRIGFGEGTLRHAVTAAQSDGPNRPRPPLTERRRILHLASPQPVAVLPRQSPVHSFATRLVRAARVDAVTRLFPRVAGTTEVSSRRAHSRSSPGRTESKQMTTKLYVGNLDFSTTEQQLRDTFAAHGSVVSASLVLDRSTGRSRGFAFVEYESSEEAERAIGALDGAALDGRQLTVNIARPRREGGGRPERGGRGDYSSGRRR